MANWTLTIDLSEVFHAEDLEFDDKKAKIVHILRTSGWMDRSAVPNMLRTAIDNLEHILDVVDFDHAWERIYDIADAERVWIETR